MSGMPSINISFTELAATAVKRGERGIVAMILNDTSAPATNPFVCTAVSDIPAGLSAANKKQITLALKGYVNIPLRVVCYVVVPVTEENVTTVDYTPAYSALDSVKFDYLVAPTASTDAKCVEIASKIAAWRSNNKLVKAVLPSYTGDSEGIINYATTSVTEDSTTYTAEQYCSRIAGIIAGTPISISCTYAPLAELTDCERLTKAQMDTAVDAGKLIVWWDGEKVKIARGVNSLTTLTSSKNSQFQKIKIVDAMDMIASDIKMTAEDNYLGKYANTYNNKCLLISAIGNYFDTLQRDDVLNSWELGIDIDANRSYLRGKGVDVDSMTDDEIKMANTGSYVYLTATLSILDAIEDIVLPITI